MRHRRGGDLHGTSPHDAAVWRRVRLAAGLILFAYLTTHLLNHALGLISLAAMEAGRAWFLTFWRHPVGTLALYGSLTVHVTLAFWSLYQRRSLRMPGWESAQLLLGLMIPPLLISHVVGTRLAHAWFDTTSREPTWEAEALESANAPDAAGRARLERMHSALLGGFVASLGAVFLGRAARQAQARRRGTVRLTYPDGRQVRVLQGFTVLEASRLAGIPHASVCGGRGRCSTCRVHIPQGFESLPAPAREELRVLRRVGAPPNVRLACQLRPPHDISIVPLLPATASARDGIAQPGYIAGQEREIAVLFADLRRFTALAERRLPYDVVFLLNRYCETVGTSIERAGGVPNQFTGDGVMALFGVETGPDDGCRRALLAAREIIRSLDALSQTLVEELDAPLEVGIGIHAGPAIIGQMGYGAALYLTAVGDTVNVASRFQELTKQVRLSARDLRAGRQTDWR